MCWMSVVVVARSVVYCAVQYAHSSIQCCTVIQEVARDQSNCIPPVNKGIQINSLIPLNELRVIYKKIFMNNFFFKCFL